MKTIAGVIRAAILIMLGIYLISMSSFIIGSCFYLCFFKHGIELYEYIVLVASILVYITAYAFVFRYFMIQKVYNMRRTGEEHIILKTQFKEIHIMKKDILNKSLSYFATYKIKVMHNGKVRTFFVSHKLAS